MQTVLKIIHRRHLALLVIVWCAAVGNPLNLSAEGLPEPSMIFYGTIRNTAVNNMRLTSGILNWQIRNLSNGWTVNLSTVVSNYPGFSYVLEVPCESIISGNVSSNKLNLSAANIGFSRSQVFYGATPLNFVPPVQPTFVASSRSRGQIERVDLTVSIPCEDADGNGLCDDWELGHFGFIGVVPEADWDGDGMSNRAEFQAGTDPTDADSALQFISYAALAPGVVKVDWESADGRSYRLLRTTNVFSVIGTNLTAAAGFTVVRSNLVATPSTNTFIDSNAPSPGPYFYRVELEQ